MGHRVSERYKKSGNWRTGNRSHVVLDSIGDGLHFVDRFDNLIQVSWKKSDL